MKENLKVLMINGSPNANGNTAVALKEMENIFKENGIEVETVVIGNKAVRGCIACGSCYETFYTYIISVSTISSALTLILFINLTHFI